MVNANALKKSMVTNKMPPTTCFCARKVRTSSTKAVDCPGTTNSKYSLNVRRSRSSAMTFDRRHQDQDQQGGRATIACSTRQLLQVERPGWHEIVSPPLVRRPRDV